ncbi:MAG: FAD-dependent oxidoreductase [Ignisphaera sp.]|nr:FAD-dependent oxidoreductase [Ignisphaera sp.]
MSQTIVVVGGGAAGASAAARAKRLNPNAEVVLIEATDMITHAPCGIPYYIGGSVKKREDLATYTPEEFEKERGIKVYINSTVKDVDADRKVAIVERNGHRFEVRWNKLVIATGAIPAVPPVPGVDLKGVYTIRHPAHAHKLLEDLRNARKVAVVGGSYLGLEMTEALLELGKSVVLIEKGDRLLPKALDHELAEIVAKEVLEKSVELHLGEGIKEIIGSNGAVKAVATDKGVYEVDTVVLATGVKPSVWLATRAGAKLGVTGAVEVNEYMETSVEGVYAAGDVAEKTHRVTGKKVWIPLATSANKEGQVAGANAARGRVLRFPGVVGTAVTKFFDLYIARTGLGEEEAVANGFKVEKAVIKARTKAHYYPGATEVHIKMIMDSSTGRILGAQAVGRDPIVAGYIDVVAVAVERGMTIEDLFFADLGYHPAVAPVWHPLIVAARVLSKGRF